MQHDDGRLGGDAGDAARRRAKTAAPALAALALGVLLVLVVTLAEWAIGRPIVNSGVGGVLVVLLGVATCLGMAGLVSRALR